MNGLPLYARYPFTFQARFTWRADKPSDFLWAPLRGRSRPIMHDWWCLIRLLPSPARIGCALTPVPGGDGRILDAAPDSPRARTISFAATPSPVSFQQGTAENSDERPDYALAPSAHFRWITCCCASAMPPAWPGEGAGVRATNFAARWLGRRARMIYFVNWLRLACRALAGAS